MKRSSAQPFRSGVTTRPGTRAQLVKPLCGRRAGSRTVGGCAGCESGWSETDAATEEAAEVRGIGETEVFGHGSRVPPGASQETPGFEQATLVDELAYPLAGGVVGGAAEGANRTAQQLGVVRGLVQFAEVQLQGVHEPTVGVTAARGGCRGGGGCVRGVGQAQ